MTLMSMTGFGDARVSTDRVELVVEIKSVNHRFLDVNTKLPNAYSRFEVEVAKAAKARLKRGRVEIYVTRNDVSSPSYEAKFDEELFQAYLRVLRQGLLAAAASSKDALASGVIQILAKREVLDVTAAAADVSDEWSLLEQAVHGAITSLLEMRVKEGEELEREITAQLEAVESLVGRIAAACQQQPADYRERLLARLEKMNLDLNQLDPDRLAQEVAYFVDRADVSEEIARLGSHITQFREIIESNDGGRKLEFLLQEFGREFNTIGSKSQSSEVTALVVEGKAVLERIREQVANIE